MRELSLHVIATVIKREYLQRVRTRSFAASTIFIPALFAALLAISSHHSAVSASSAHPAPNAAMLGAIVAVGMLLYVLFISIFSYGAIVMRSVLDEKQSRVLELLLCFASSEELMAGKILGIGALALTQVLVWLGLGVSIALFSETARHALALLHFGPVVLIYFVVFEVLGYLLYSAMFCAIGAAFNSTDEAQQWTLVLVLPLIASSVLISPVMFAPNSTLAITASLIPFTSPVLMYARIAIGHPPAWQVILCVALLLASVTIAISITARIYRVGILMYGKRPTAREIIHWIRYA